jgi:hypothetical protein
MMQNVIRLHLNHISDRDSFHLPVFCPHDYGAAPCVWQTLDELKDMLPNGPEQGQGNFYGSMVVRPPIRPCSLCQRQVPPQVKFSVFVPDCHLDTEFPDVISINNVMYDLANGPSATWRCNVKFITMQADYGTFENGWPLPVSRDRGLAIAWCVHAESLSEPPAGLPANGWSLAARTRRRIRNAFLVVVSYKAPEQSLDHANSTNPCEGCASA